MRASSRKYRRHFSRQAVLMALLAAQVICLMLWHIVWPQPAVVQLTEAPVELSILISEASLSVWQQLAIKFEETHPNITVRIDPDSDDTAARERLYKEDFRFSETQGDKARYDLVFMDVIWMESFKDNLMNLNPFIAKSDLDTSDFLDSEIDIGSYDAGLLRQDALYRLPMYPDVGLLYYRKDLLEAAGLPLPETLEALQQTIQTIQKMKLDPDVVSGYLWQGDDYEGLVVNFFELMRGLGGSWISDGQAELTSETTLQAASTLKQLIQAGISPEMVTDYTETSSKDAFINGEAIFLRGWPDFWTDMQQAPGSKVKGKVAIAHPFSFVPGKTGVSCRGGWGFGISKKSEHPEEAWKLIEYFTSEDVQKEFVLASSSLPSRKSLYDDPQIIETYPFMRELRTYIDDFSEFRPQIKAYLNVSDILQSSLSDMLRQEGVVVSAMEAAQQKTQNKLRQSAADR